MQRLTEDKSIQQYSIVISPPDAVIQQVQQLKQQLRSAIGWYSSVNAWAHITFNVFLADADALLRWERYTEAFAAEQSPVHLRFLRTDAFANGAFFLAPDAASEQSLVAMMQAFHRAAPIAGAQRPVTPHLSIGRRLRPDQLSIARTLIPGADIHFVCNDLVLRRFNPDRGQYDIYRRFGFAGM